MKTHNSNRANTSIVKSLLREPYAWPGGYERLGVTSDGELLCSKCLKENAKQILRSTKYKHGDGWEISGACYEAVSAECAKEVDEELVSHCGHCSKEIGETD